MYLFHEIFLSTNYVQVAVLSVRKQRYRKSDVPSRAYASNWRE